MPLVSFGVFLRGSLLAGGSATQFRRPGDIQAEKDLDQLLERPSAPPPPPPKLPEPVVTPVLLVLIANLYLHRYIHQEKEDKDCIEKLAPYKIHKYKYADKLTDEDTPDSHHMLQNAFFQSSKDRRKGIPSEICPGYKARDGLCIPLNEKEHDVITRMQDVFAMKIANRTGTLGAPLTYPEAREEMKAQLKTVKSPKPIDEATAECAAKLVDAQLAEKCPSVLSGKTPLRTPL